MQLGHKILRSRDPVGIAHHPSLAEGEGEDGVRAGGDEIHLGALGRAAQLSLLQTLQDLLQGEGLFLFDASNADAMRRVFADGEDGPFGAVSTVLAAGIEQVDDFLIVELQKTRVNLEKVARPRSGLAGRKQSLQPSQEVLHGPGNDAYGALVQSV